MQKISTPPLSSPATLMTTIKPPPMSSLGGYDASRNLYPSSPAPSLIPFASHANSSRDIQSSWGDPLPTNVPQPLMHSPKRIAPPREGHNPYNPPHRSNRREQYFLPRNPPHCESPQGYANSTGKYPEEHPRLLPNSHLASPSNLPIRTSQDYHHPRPHPRPRIATSSYPVSSSSHATTATGLSTAASPTLPAAGAAAIIHSPVLLSPRMPSHHSPPSYNSYPLPPLTHGSDSRSGVDPREHTPQYIQPAHSHFQGHSRQHSSSSITGWSQPSSPRVQDRHYHQPPNVSYEDRRNTGVTRVDSSEPRREHYPDFPPGTHDYPSRVWHSSSAPHSSPWTTDAYPKPGWRG